mgnify:FL=1
MQTSMKLLLTAPPDQCRAALRFGLPVAHVAYRVGGGPHLFRASIPVSVRGGLMVIDNTGFDGRGEAGPFCQEVLRECMARGYDGILCDFEGHPLQVLAQAVRTLGELTKKRGWPLYVTEAYAPFSDSAIALIPSALSGGSLQQRLQEAVERFGAARVALAVERVAEDFFLPSPSGSGTPLSQDELHRRIHQLSPSIFFSQELCARYFTYMSRESGAHFVLFDDGATLRRKLEAAQSLDIRTVLAPWQEISDVTVTLGLYPVERTRTGQVLR